MTVGYHDHGVGSAVGRGPSSDSFLLAGTPQLGIPVGAGGPVIDGGVGGFWGGYARSRRGLVGLPAAQPVQDRGGQRGGEEAMRRACLPTR